MFYENWESRAAFDAHLEMPHLKPLMRSIDALLARPIEIKRYEMLSGR